MSNVSATWSVDLNTECPNCGEYIDMNDDGSFTNGERAYALQILTDVPVDCPECNHKFKVDLEW